MPTRTLAICAVGAGLITAAAVVSWRQDVLFAPPQTEVPPAPEFAARLPDPNAPPYVPDSLRFPGFWQLGSRNWPTAWSGIVAVVGPENERRRAVAALEGSADLRALPTLEYVLTHDSCGNLRREAATASLNLASCYDEDQQEQVGLWLAKEAQHRDPRVRAAVFRGVAWDPYYRVARFVHWLAKPLARGLRDPDLECRREAATSVYRITRALFGASNGPPPGWLDALTECLRGPSPGPRTRTSLGKPQPPMSSSKFGSLAAHVRAGDGWVGPVEGDAMQQWSDPEANRLSALVRLWELGTPRARRLVRESLAEQPLR